MRVWPFAVVFLACSDDATPTSAQCSSVEVLVAASDYSSSLVCGAPACADKRSIALGTDPQLALTNGRAFYLARDNDLVFEIDPKCGTPTSQFSVHALAPKDGSANPHDAAAAADGTVVLPLYGSAKLAFAKNGVVDALDLSRYDDDGNPQADAVSIVGGKAFVTLERLDDHDHLRSTRPSQMLRIDVASRTVEAVVELAGRNPFNRMAQLNGALFLTEPGSFDLATEDLAGIERFDTTTSTTRLLVHEKDLGGSAAEVAVTDGCGVAIVAGQEANVNPTSLVTFDPDSGKVLATVLGPTPGYDLQGLAWRGTTLYVGDRRASTLHLLDRGAGCTLTPNARTIALPEGPVAIGAAL